MKTKTRKDESERYKEQSTVQTLSHFPSLPWKLCPNMWKSSFEIYALKTSGKEEGAGWGWGGGIMAHLLSLWDHNDDKESVTLLL